MADMVFWRTGVTCKEGAVAGVLQIGEKFWPTIERGDGYTYVRKGTYVVTVGHKNKVREAGGQCIMVRCLRFGESPAIASHLIHDAYKDKHTALLGCIAPGLSADATGIHRSEEAMQQVLETLGVIDATGCLKVGERRTIDVLNNVGGGDETKREWIDRRERDAKAKAKAKAK
jgi:hypothetical protein